MIEGEHCRYSHEAVMSAMQYVLSITENLYHKLAASPVHSCGQYSCLMHLYIYKHIYNKRSRKHPDSITRSSRVQSGLA